MGVIGDALCFFLLNTIIVLLFLASNLISQTKVTPLTNLAEVTVHGLGYSNTWDDTTGTKVDSLT